MLAAVGNPFSPDLRDETVTALVAAREASLGARPVDVTEFAAAPVAAWKSTVSGRGA